VRKYILVCSVQFLSGVHVMRQVRENYASQVPLCPGRLGCLFVFSLLELCVEFCNLRKEAFAGTHAHTPLE